MNIRSLTRSDGAVIGAAVLLFIASFLAFFEAEDCTGDDCTVSAWDPALFPMLPTVHLAALIAAGLLVLGRIMAEGPKIAGMSLDQWGTVIAVFVGWATLWSLLANLIYDPSGNDLNDKIGLGAGAWLTLLGGLAVAASALLGTLLPALQAPLLPAARPQAPNPYGPGPQQGGYGYPGAGQPGPGPQQHGMPQQGMHQQGMQQGQGPQQQFGGGQPGPGPQQQGQPGPGGIGAPADPNFQPFWFAVPVARPLFGEDGSPSPIAELAPGTWYLAVDQRGPALIAQTQDGRRGVLQDTSGIQRG